MSNDTDNYAFAHSDLILAWREKTNADILTEIKFQELKAQYNFYVVGVMGFSGEWNRSGLRGRSLAQFINDCRFMLNRELLTMQELHASKLLVSTGATNQGVLQAVYNICAQVGITAMGVTCRQGLNYPVGKLKYLMPFGNTFGDESGLFVRTSDAFLLLGGGKQSEKETLMAQAAHKPITVIQGFGGVADEFTSHILPNARFLQRTSS